MKVLSIPSLQFTIQASPLPLYKNILEHILVVNDTQATEQIKFMGC